jgi:hypothetical protein
MTGAGQNAVHDFDNNRSRYFLQIWQYEPLSASNTAVSNVLEKTGQV